MDHCQMELDHLQYQVLLLIRLDYQDNALSLS
jgi:hypothetical protein